MASMPMRLWLCSAIVFAVAGCSDDILAPAIPDHTLDLEFSETTQGWSAGFSDFSVGMDAQMDLEAGHTPLPEELAGAGGGLYIAGTNHSDDLFMFWKGRVEGLEPGGRYQAEFAVEFATNSPAGCYGIGGAPGESVYVKAGAAAHEPEPVEMAHGDSGYWQMNVDKGNQAAPGSDAVILGDVGIDTGTCTTPAWGMKSLASEERLSVEAAEDGTLWLFVGTDSGFEGRTELYYTRLRAWLFAEG